MNQLRISATAHGLNYLPEYYAKATGGFSRRELEVLAVARDPWTGTLDDIMSGAADVVLGGIWVPAMYAGMGRDFVAFAQLNARFPMTIVTREPVADFSWEWLLGRTVLAPGAGGTAPYEFTAGVMREHGVDLSQVKFVRDLSTDLLRELYEHGLGDALIADPLTTQELIDAGAGYPAIRLAEVAGPMPNSVYYVQRARLEELHVRLVALSAAVDEAMVALRTGADADSVIETEWPQGPHGSMQRAAGELAANGTWSGVRIEPQPLERWLSMLHERGLMRSPSSYEQLVSTAAVDEALGLIPGAPL